MIVKVVEGYVKQTFDNDGNLVDQQFVASSDYVEYFDENGKAIVPADIHPKKLPYHSFDMVNPKDFKENE